MNSQNNGNNRKINTCCGRSMTFVVHTFIMAFSSFIFVSSLGLAAYLTPETIRDDAIVVLIVSCSLLYISGFCGSFYSCYFERPISVPSEDIENSNSSNQTIGSSAQSNSVNARPPDLGNFRHTREVIRPSPPPPYNVEMSEMQQKLPPGTSGTIESSAREAEIVEGARKLIKNLYEDMMRKGELEPQSSTDEQQVVRTPRATMQQQTMSPKVSHQNLVVQKQQTVAKSSPGRVIPRVRFCTNPVIQQKVAHSSLPPQLGSGRSLIGGEGCTAINPQHSSRIPDLAPSDLGSKQVIKQTATPNQTNVERSAIGNNGCSVAPPQLSPRIGERILKVPHKKLTSPSENLQAGAKTKGNITQMPAIGKIAQTNEYVEIDVAGSIQSENSSLTYDSVESYCTRSELEGSCGESVASGTSEPSLEERKTISRTPKGKEPRKLSILSTRKLTSLGASPQTRLNVIAECAELNDA